MPARDLPEKIDSKFRFVLVAAQRAEQLMRGARPHVDAVQNKATRVAQVEVGKGLINWDYGPQPEEESAAEAQSTTAVEDVH